MSVLSSLKLVMYSPVNHSSIEFVRRRKLITKIDEQLVLLENPSYQPTQMKTVKEEDGTKRKIEIPKRIKSWWSATVDGKVNLTIRYGSKAIEFTKGKNAIELEGEEQVAATLQKIKEAVQVGEFDALIAQQLQNRRPVKSK